MNAKQKQEVIKMYAETIEAENDVKKRIRHIEKLKDTFSAEIENWEDLLCEYADRKRLMGVISAMDVRSGHTPHTPSMPIADGEEVHKGTTMPVYTPKSQEQLDAEMKEFNEKRMRYVMLMSFADTLYKQGKLTLENYYFIQDAFGKFYGFTEKSLFYWDGPHIDGEPIVKDTHRRNKTYTRRNTAYWEEYEKKHKK